MTFRLGLKGLASFARRMGQMLEAGISIRRALAIMERGAPLSMKRLYRGLGLDIENGRTFSQSLEHQGRRFPVLFRRLVQVGEAVGGLDETLRRLAEYYEMMRSLWTRTFVRMIYPVFQYFMLILVLALVKALPMYLMGRPGALAAFMKIFGTGLAIFCAPIVLYFAGTRLLGGSRAMHAIVNKIPVAGNVFRTLAIARFSMAMEMMTEGGVQIFNAITWSLEATANGVFSAQSKHMIARLQGGMPLSDALEKTHLFPYDYTEAMHVAEESGSLPDTFKRLAKIYMDKANTALAAASWALCILMFVAVAGVIIFYIFTFAMQYINTIGSLTGGGEI